MFNKGILFGVLLELGMHIFVHYTLPGAQFASGLAKFLAPGLDAVGLTTVFSEVSSLDSGAGALSSTASKQAGSTLPALESLSKSSLSSGAPALPSLELLAA